MQRMSFWLGLIVICLLVFLACDDESGVVPQPPQIDRNHELQRGWSLFRMKDYDAAAVHFDAVVEHFPDAADGYIGLGWCEIEGDHLELALDHLQTADRLANEPDAIAVTECRVLRQNPPVDKGRLHIFLCESQTGHEIRHRNPIWNFQPDIGVPDTFAFEFRT